LQQVIITRHSPWSCDRFLLITEQVDRLPAENFTSLYPSSKQRLLLLGKLVFKTGYHSNVSCSMS
jgi:hypothetical protein